MLKAGAEARVRFDALPERVFRGQIFARVASGDDSDLANGIDRAMLFFYAGHGNPEIWNTLGNSASNAIRSTTIRRSTLQSLRVSFLVMFLTVFAPSGPAA